MADGKNTDYNDVVSQVLDEVKSLGSNTQKTRDDLSKQIKTNYEELKSYIDETIDSNDVLVKERIDKLSHDISVRQEELDKKSNDTNKEITERFDNLEVALKRIPQNSGNSADMQKEAQEFFRTAAAVQSHDGLSFDDAEKADVDLDNYKKYKKALDYYFRKDSKLVTPEQYKALQVGIDPSGGYTVTPAMAAQIIKKIYESDPIRQLASTERITTNAIEWNVEWSEASAGWEEETVSGAETATPTFNKKRIPVYTMYAKPKATQQLLEDSGINVANWLANKVGEKFMRVEGASFITGTGVGQPRGILTYSNGTTYGTVEQVVSGNASAVTADGLIDLKYSMNEYFLNRGTFLMNRSTVAALIKLKDGQGNYLWRPGFQDAQSNLLGLPVRMSTTMPVIAANALSIVLADFKEAYMIVDRLGITIQKDPYTKKPFVEFYTRKRVGGDIVNYDAIKIQKISA